MASQGFARRALRPPPPPRRGHRHVVARAAPPTTSDHRRPGASHGAGRSRRAHCAPVAPPVSGGGRGGSRGLLRRVPPVPDLDAEQRVQADGRSWGPLPVRFPGLDDVHGDVEEQNRGDDESIVLACDVIWKEVSKFYNGKSGSLVMPPAAIIPSVASGKGPPKPGTPSPGKRKGLLPSSFKWGRAQNKEAYLEEDVVDSPPTTCRRMTLSPAATSSSGSNSGSDDEAQKLPPRRPPRSSSGSNSGSDDEAQKLPPRRPPRRSGSGTGVFASPPTPRPPKLFPAHNRSQSMRELQDVTDSTSMVSPRDKLWKN